MLLHLVTLLLASGATASWSGNINFGSPSPRHPFMSISMPKVMKRSEAASYIPASNLTFTHGVASGDPYPHSVILWTRIAPMVENDRSNVTVNGTAPFYNHMTEKYVESSLHPVCVEYKVSKSENLSDPVYMDKAYTSSDIDFTVKVEAKQLQPFTLYYYQFNVCDSNKTSPLGRTKTAPRPDDDVSEIGLAVFSCSNYRESRP